MSLFATVFVPIAIGVVATESILVARFNRKQEKITRKQKELYYALWTCNQKKLWEKKGASFYKVYAFPYTINLFREKEAIRVQVRKKKYMVLDFAINEEQHLTLYRNHSKKWFDVFEFLQGDEVVYREWATSLQNRFRAEEEREKEQIITPFQQEWMGFKEEERRSFENMIQMLKQVPSLYLHKTGTFPLWLDRFFSFTCYIEEEKVYCDLSFANGITLFKSETNRKTGETEVQFYKEYYLLPEQMEECESVVQTITTTPAYLLQSQRREEPQQPKGIPLIFQETVERINRLGKEREWLSDTEKHLVYYTYPNDLQEMMQVYQALSEDGKLKAVEMMKHTQKDWHERLQALQEQVEKRKLRQLEQRLRIVKVRGN